MKVELHLKSNFGVSGDVLKVTIYLGHYCLIRRCELPELIKLLQEEAKLCQHPVKTSDSHQE